MTGWYLIRVVYLVVPGGFNHLGSHWSYLQLLLPNGSGSFSIESLGSTSAATNPTSRWAEDPHFHHGVINHKGWFIILFQSKSSHGLMASRFLPDRASCWLQTWSLPSCSNTIFQKNFTQLRLRSGVPFSGTNSTLQLSSLPLGVDGVTAVWVIPLLVPGYAKVSLCWSWSSFLLCVCYGVVFGATTPPKS